MWQEVDFEQIEKEAGRVVTTTLLKSKEILKTIV